MSPESCWFASPVGATALLQAELLSNVIEVRLVLETMGTAAPRITPTAHPLAIVLTQDCDADLDHKARFGDGAAHRIIPNLLLCDVDDAESMKAGLSSSRAWETVKTNQNERYHVLPTVSADISVLPERFRGILGLDFRRLFTVPTDELYKRVELGEAVRCCYLEPNYRDHLSNRFYGYQMRVALPGTEAS